MDKIVLFLIDALRADFVYGNATTIPFVQQKLEESLARGFIAKARTPTVTLPRLKALLSGSIPNFVDVIFNFGSQEFTDDNLIKQLTAAGNRIVFYGDDTWLRMFPNSFVRSEGVTSFFASDFIEVQLHNV